MSAKSLGKRLGGVGGTAMAGGVGAVVYGANTLALGWVPGAKAPENESAAARSKRMRTYSWGISAPAAVLLVASHFVRKNAKTAAIGQAMAGAAGYALAETVVLGRQIRANNPVQAETKGLETGAMLSQSSPLLQSYGQEAGAMLTFEEMQGQAEAAGYDEGEYSDAMGL